MRRILPALLVLGLAACGDNAEPGTPDASVVATPDASEVVIIGLDASTPAPKDAGSNPSTGMLIYAHTDKSLFQLDPNTKPLKLNKIGDFDCVGSGKWASSMTDLAVDQNGKLFAMSSSAVFPLSVTGTTVHCDEKWALQSSGSFYGLTFAPAGAIHATETLVAADTAGQLWAIDQQGSAVQVGAFGKVPTTDGHGHTYPSANVGKNWELSGDIVFLTNGGNWVGFATLRDCPNPPSPSGCSTVDTLVEIDVSKLQPNNTASVVKSIRGKVVKALSGCSDSREGYGSMYGIAAWNDKVYGFSHSGFLVEIDNTDGSACLVQTYSGELFTGAGVSTQAPVIEPL